MINNTQVRVLYREFLFRMVDRELLSTDAQGDSNKLLGRFAAILILLSLGFAVTLLGIGSGRGNGGRERILLSALGPEHALIATTMLIVAIFTVLSWESLFPDRRDVLVLAPLPVSPANIFLAKAVSLATALGVTVALFAGIPGLLLPFALTPPSYTILDMLFSIDFYRTALAYSVTVVLAGGFILCCIVCVQALAAQFPRAIFLRLSAVLQIATFCLCVTVYFLQPSLASAAQLDRPQNQQALHMLPSYWFLGLFQQLNGYPIGLSQAALTDLAHRAWIAFGVAFAGAAGALVVFCVRTLRKIAEQPDIAPARRRSSVALPLGNSITSAIVHFTSRTMLRSRQHRVLVAFYTGVGFAAVILFLNTPVVRMLSAARPNDAWRLLSLPLLASSFVMLCCWVIGVRVVFAIPVELRANWTFRIATSSPRKTIRGARTAFYIVGLLPCWIVSAAAFLWLWPWRPAAKHIVVLSLIGFALCTLCLRGFHKIPFTCSYLPGKSNIHITLMLTLTLGLNGIFWASSWERRALFDGSQYLALLTILVVAAGAAWKWMDSEAGSEQQEIRFDEQIEAEILSLGIAGKR